MSDVQTAKPLKLKMKSSAKPQRIRRSPEAARAEILAAARGALEEVPFSALTVDIVMSRTGMTRSLFYHYFDGLQQVAVALLAGVEQGIRDAVDAWLTGELGEPDHRAATENHLTDMFRRMDAHRAVMRAASDAATGNPEVYEDWQRRVVGSYVELTAEFIRREVAAGRSRVSDPDQVGYALIMMNNGVASDNARREDPQRPETIGRTLAGIWNATIYGPQGH